MHEYNQYLIVFITFNKQLLYWIMYVINFKILSMLIRFINSTYLKLYMMLDLFK